MEDKEMTYKQIKEYFKNKENVACPLTDELVNSGYRQNNGYIIDARKAGIENPSQWWHIMNHCTIKENAGKCELRYRYTPCGELVFWMAEVTEAVDKAKLESLKNTIVNSGDVKKRRQWNKAIKYVCWDKICRKIEEDIR